MSRKYYCLCDANCKFETMTKEQILIAIAQAAENGLVVDLDGALVSRVQEQNGAQAVTFWAGTQAQYNALAEKDPYCIYVITDSTEKADLSAALAAANEKADAASATAASALNAAIVSAVNNGKVTDALEVDWTNYTADIHNPHVVDTAASNIPDGFGGGVRLVFPVTFFLYVILLVGQSDSDKKYVGNVWVNTVRPNGDNEAGYSASGWQRLNNGEQQGQQEQQELVDYIVETGSEGIWSWRKWNSGYVELDGKKNFYSTSSLSQSGNLYFAYLGAVTYPFELTELTTISCGFQTTKGNVWHWCEGAGTTGITNSYIGRGSSAAVEGYPTFHITGKWK